MIFITKPKLQHEYFLLSLLFLGMNSAALFGQTRVLKGTVISSVDNRPIKGASVTIKGRSGGATTDDNGDFSLSDAGLSTGTLVVSFVGMQSQEIPITVSGDYTITLSPGTGSLGEVVVTALGISREKRALGYAVQNLSGDDIRKTQEVNLVNSLQGKAAGSLCK